MIVAWALPIFLWGQSPPAPSTQQFTEISEALAARANVLLVNADQPVVVAVKAGSDRENVYRRPAPSPERRPMQLKVGNPTSAVTRVELLRAAIDPILRREGVPVELAAVVLVESGGNTFALSPKGARGLWQLMPDTARRYGLVVDGARDERVDVEKSTRAAARYLSDLHLQFGSWPLALAAYNTGEQNLQRAIDKSPSAEFNVLSAARLLPLETRNYVPAVLAATQLFSWPFVLKVEQSAPPAMSVFAVSSQ